MGVCCGADVGPGPWLSRPSLPSQASQEELRGAYRRLCMLYHPDKHRDPELKSQAERLFNLVHQAYEGGCGPSSAAAAAGVSAGADVLPAS